VKAYSTPGPSIQPHRVSLALKFSCGSAAVIDAMLYLSSAHAAPALP